MATARRDPSLIWPVVAPDRHGIFAAQAQSSGSSSASSGWSNTCATLPGVVHKLSVIQASPGGAMARVTATLLWETSVSSVWTCGESSSLSSLNRCEGGGGGLNYGMDR